MDGSELLKGFSYLILNICKLLSESIHVHVVAFSSMAFGNLRLLPCLLSMVTLLRA